MAKQLLVEVVGDTSRFERSMSSAGTSSEHFGGKLEKLRGVLALAGGAFAAVGVAEFAKSAIEGAENLEKANRSLETALRAVGGGAEKLLPQFQATAKAAAQFGITQTQATQSLSRAVLITHNAQAAQRAYNEAVVISKATGKDLNAVLLATAKAQDGQVGSLKRYGVILDKSATGQQQLNAVMGAFKGQAEANTTASQRMSADFQNLQATIGTYLLPAFDKVVVAITDVINWFSSPQVAQAVQGWYQTILAYVQPIVDWFKTHWPQIQQVVSKVMADVKTVIEGVLAGLEAFWRQWGSTITAIVRNAITTVEAVFKGVVQVIKGVAEVIDGIIHGRWSEVWQGAKDIVTGVFKALFAYLKGVATQILVIVEAVGRAIMQGIANGIKAAARLVADALDAAIINPINALISLLDGIHISIPKVHIPFVGDVGGGSIGFNVPHIPSLDSGGLVTQTGLAMVHRGEVFSGVRNQQGFGQVNVTVNGWVGNDQQIAQKVRAELLKTGRRQGGHVLGRYA